MAAACVALFVWRLVELASHPGPSGIDMANYFRVFQGWFHQLDLSGVVYPPVVPALAGVLRLVLGTLWAARLLPAMAGLAPGLGVWWAGRQFAPWWFASTTGVLLGASVPTSATVGWAGVPQLIGLGLWPVLAMSTVRLAELPSRRAALRTGTLLSLILLTSTLIGIASICTVPLVLLACSSRLRNVRWFPSALWGLIPVASILPWYVPIVGRMSLKSGRVSDVPASGVIRMVTGGQSWIWALAVVLALFGAGAALRVLASSSSALVALILVAAAGLFAREWRFGYLFPSALALAANGLAFASLPVRRAMALIGVPVAAAVLITAIPEQADSIAFYTTLVPPGFVDASSWVHQHSERGDVIAVASRKGVPTGWWVEATGRAALVASREDWLYFPGERREASLANRFFDGGLWPTGPQLEALAEADVRFLIIDERETVFSSNTQKINQVKFLFHLVHQSGFTLVFERSRELVEHRNG